jgi:hypothetical protein
MNKPTIRQATIQDLQRLVPIFDSYRIYILNPYVKRLMP